MRSDWTVDTLQIGDVVCDMHDGFPVQALADRGLVLRDRIRVQTPHGSKFIENTVRWAANDPLYRYTNKLLVVTGESSTGALQAMYASDGHVLGIVEFSREG